MIKVVEFYKEIRAGSSLPLIVGGKDGTKYVVKLRGGGDGVLANVVEWLAIKLGRLAQIPVLDPELLVIEAGFEQIAQDPEIRELLARSTGVNLGTKYVEAAFTYNEQSAHDLDDQTKTRIFLFDLFLLNVDRHAGNSNIIFNDRGLWCLDYSSALTMRSAIDGKDYETLALFKEIKRHSFYRSRINAHDFIRTFKTIGDGRFRDIVDTLPDEWIRLLPMAGEPREVKRLIGKRLIEQKNNVHVLLKRLDLLQVLNLETAEARRLRTLGNREEFERKFGKL